jgi:hypothetical protein
MGGRLSATQRRWSSSRFREKYDVSLDWMFRGEGSGLAPHLAKPNGILAILPVAQPLREPTS